MKNTTTTSSILTKACLLSLILPATSYAQNHYDWSIDDDAAHWGDDQNKLTGGSYTRDHVIWSGPSTGESWSIPVVEGPYDGNSGVVWAPSSTGIMTRTDPNAIFDLSTVGSSATIRTAYHYQTSYEDTGGHAHMYQFGLTNNASYFGKAGNESLIVASDYQNQDHTAGTATYDLDLLNHSGMDTTGNGNWTPAPMLEVASGLEVSSWSSPDDPRVFRPGKSHAIELTYTNLGGGKLQVDVGVMELNISGRTAADTLTSTNQVVQNTFIVDNNFSDLSSLRPGFGVAFNDSDHPNTGASFDWEAAYPTDFSKVPEPSSASLLALGSLALILRRRK